ncbi:MAG: 50S ribosomal protein L29 [Anaerolineae bacterium]|nr:50S ribosomal protein L29 [Anaerolineae bacterium]MDW8071394.1 50S ribosomal protein L29 [Anaerolineae bacterium]
MRPQEIRALSDVELQARLRSVQEELFNLRFQKVIGQLQNYNRLTQLKRDIARLKTEMRMRQLRRQSA